MCGQEHFEVYFAQNYRTYIKKQIQILVRFEDSKIDSTTFDQSKAYDDGTSKFEDFIVPSQSWYLIALENHATEQPHRAWRPEDPGNDCWGTHYGQQFALVAIAERQNVLFRGFLQWGAE